MHKLFVVLGYKFKLLELPTQFSVDDSPLDALVSFDKSEVFVGKIIETDATCISLIINDPQKLCFNDVINPELQRNIVVEMGKIGFVRLKAPQIHFIIAPELISGGVRMPMRAAMNLSRK